MWSGNAVPGEVNPDPLLSPSPETEPQIESFARVVAQGGAPGLSTDLGTSRASAISYLNYSTDEGPSLLSSHS